MTSEPVWWCYFYRWLCVLFCAGLPRRVVLLLHVHIYRHSSWLPSQGFSGGFLVAINKLPMWCYYLLRVIYSFSQKLPPGGNCSAWDFLSHSLLMLQWDLPSVFLLDFYEHPIWWSFAIYLTMKEQSSQTSQVAPPLVLCTTLANSEAASTKPPV